MEAMDTGCWCYVQHAPVDKAMLQPMSRVSKAGLENTVGPY